MTASPATAAAQPGRGTPDSRPVVSVLIPCRNEESCIAQCLDSVLANDYPKSSLEVLVLDGQSDDRTRLIVAEYAARWPCVRLIDNPRRIQSAALNVGIRAAAGGVLIRMDAHNTYHPAYISRSVAALATHGADNVGGVWRIEPRRPSLVGRSIARALTHPFGIGRARWLNDAGTAPRWVDSVPFFCCRRELFETVGGFDERVGPSEDMEFNLRLRRSGYRILLVPDIVSTYHARSDFRSFLRHSGWRNGLWGMLPYAYTDVMRPSLRRLAPVLMLSLLSIALVLGFFWSPAAWFAGAVAGGYGLTSLFASIQIAWRERDVRVLFVMPVLFASLHLVYAVGSFVGLARVARPVLGRAWRNSRERREN